MSIKRVIIAYTSIVLGLILFVSATAFGLTQWDGAVWEGECRDVGGVVMREHRPSGLFKGDTHACVRDGQPISWHRH